MSRKRFPKVTIESVGVELQDVQGCFPGSIVARGTSYYVRLDPNFMRFWELMAGDEILINVSKIKRVTKSFGGIK